MSRFRFLMILFLITMIVLPFNSSMQNGSSLSIDEPKNTFYLTASDDAFEDDDSFEAAKDITLNTIQDRSIYPIADPDFVAFELDSFYSVTIKINNTNGDTRMWLYNYQQIQLAFDDNVDDNNLNASLTFSSLEPGIYFIRIEETGNDAEIDSYSLSITATMVIDPYEGDNPIFLPEIFLNSSLVRSIYYPNEVDEDYFSFTSTSTFNITLEITGTPGGDTVMDVRMVPDEIGTIIASDDDSGEGLYSKIEFTNLSPGTYYVVILGYNEQLVENYTLHLTAYNKTYSDTTGPSIIHIDSTLSEPKGDAGAEIWINIWDYFGISEATLHYRVNIGNWIETPIVNRLHYYWWFASIGPFDEGDFVEYYISARDNSKNKNLAVDNNSDSYYNFNILYNDFEGPTIENVHNIPSSPNDIDTVTINCSISDEHDIYNASLFYRVNYGGWTNQLMTHDSNDIYLATIGSFEYDDFVEYYITTIDNTPNYNIAINNNSGNYYNFTIVTSDSIGPSISSIEHLPAPPDETDLITISCSIIDINGIQSATLFYRINEGSWENTILSLVSSSIYEATIGTFEVDDLVNYYIKAIDNHPVHNERINDNSGSYYSFTIVRSDIIPPTISEITLSNENPIDRQSVNISCIVLDENGVYSVRLYFRINGNSWYSVQMTLVSDNNYSATTLSFDEGDFVEFYIEAVDDSPFLNIAIDDNDGNYYNFNVITITSEKTILYIIPIIGAISVVAILRKKK